MIQIIHLEQRTWHGAFSQYNQVVPNTKWTGSCNAYVKPMMSQEQYPPARLRGSQPSMFVAEACSYLTAITKASKLISVTVSRNWEVRIRLLLGKIYSSSSSCLKRTYETQYCHQPLGLLCVQAATLRRTEVLKEFKTSLEMNVLLQASEGEGTDLKCVIAIDDSTFSPTLALHFNSF